MSGFRIQAVHAYVAIDHADDSECFATLPSRGLSGKICLFMGDERKLAILKALGQRLRKESGAHTDMHLVRFSGREDMDDVHIEFPKPVSPYNGFRFTQLFAYAGINENNDDEEIPAFTDIHAKFSFPLVAADLCRLESLRPAVNAIAHHRAMHLVRFGTREDISE